MSSGNSTTSGQLDTGHPREQASLPKFHEVSPIAESSHTDNREKAYEVLPVAQALHKNDDEDGHEVSPVAESSHKNDDQQVIQDSCLAEDGSARESNDNGEASYDNANKKTLYADDNSFSAIEDENTQEHASDEDHAVQSIESTKQYIDDNPEWLVDYLQNHPKVVAKYFESMAREYQKESIKPDPRQSPVPSSTPKSMPKSKPKPTSKSEPKSTPTNSDPAIQISNAICNRATERQRAIGGDGSYPYSRYEIIQSQASPPSAEGSAWRKHEGDAAIRHMLNIRDEAVCAGWDEFRGEDRFREVARRLAGEGVTRTWFAVKNYWNRAGRVRSGFDERKKRQAPLATSKQGKDAEIENQIKKEAKAKSQERALEAEPGKQKKGRRTSSEVLPSDDDTFEPESDKKNSKKKARKQKKQRGSEEELSDNNDENSEPDDSSKGPDDEDGQDRHTRCRSPTVSPPECNKNLPNGLDEVAIRALQYGTRERRKPETESEIQKPGSTNRNAGVTDAVCLPTQEKSGMVTAGESLPYPQAQVSNRKQTTTSQELLPSQQPQGSRRKRTATGHQPHYFAHDTQSFVDEDVRSRARDVAIDHTIPPGMVPASRIRKRKASEFDLYEEGHIAPKQRKKCHASTAVAPPPPPHLPTPVNTRRQTPHEQQPKHNRRPRLPNEQQPMFNPYGYIGWDTDLRNSLDNPPTSTSNQLNFSLDDCADLTGMADPPFGQLASASAHGFEPQYTLGLGSDYSNQTYMGKNSGFNPYHALGDDLLNEFELDLRPTGYNNNTIANNAPARNMFDDYFDLIPNSDTY